jgi:tetratricopeptide (TPR) repeat protein
MSFFGSFFRRKKEGVEPGIDSKQRQELRINPQDAEAWYNNGLAEQELGRIPDAIISFQKFIELASCQIQKVCLVSMSATAEVQSIMKVYLCIHARKGRQATIHTCSILDASGNRGVSGYGV